MVGRRDLLHMQPSNDLHLKLLQINKAKTDKPVQTGNRLAQHFTKEETPWPVNVGSSAQPPPWAGKCRGNHMRSFYSPTKMAKLQRQHVPRGDLQTLACIAWEAVGSICKSQGSATYVLALPLLGVSLRQMRVQYARKFIHVRCSQEPYF